MTLVISGFLLHIHQNNAIALCKIIANSAFIWERKHQPYAKTEQLLSIWAFLFFAHIIIYATFL